MPVTIDKLLGQPLLHKHKDSDISDTSNFDSKYLMVSEKGQPNGLAPLNSNGLIDQSYLSIQLPFFGSGIDGDISGINTTEAQKAGILYDETNNFYYLTRDIYPNNLVVDGILRTKGFRIFCKNTLTITSDGHLNNDGYDANGVNAGKGGDGGFFKAGGDGAAGKGVGVAAGNGAAATAPTANTLIGGFGGVGGSGWASLLNYEGVNPTAVNACPSSNDGGQYLVNSINTFFQRFISNSTTSNWQITPSVGGGSGAKSVAGTNAFSGGGGGGGGIVAIFANKIINNGLISANGGRGGDAGGTGGTFGGGGGGGGGIVFVACYSYSGNGDITADGGEGGNSISLGTTPQKNIAVAQISSNTITNNIVTLIPTIQFSQKNIYLISVHIQQSSGIDASVQSIYGNMISKAMMIGAVNFSTISNPTRRLELWVAICKSDNNNLYDDLSVKVLLRGTNPINSCRVTIDEIQNNSYIHNNFYNLTDLSGLILQQASSASNSATSIQCNFSNPISNPSNLVYMVVARAGGTSPVAGTGMTLINNQTTAPITVSEGGYNVVSPRMTNTTATAQAAIAIELNNDNSTTATPGCPGFKGKVILIKS